MTAGSPARAFTLSDVAGARKADLSMIGEDRVCWSDNFFSDHERPGTSTLSARSRCALRALRRR